METPLLMRVLAASVDLAYQASSIIRTVYESKKLNIVDKGGNDPQSKADRDAQRCVIQSLSKLFPGICIIGEEGELDPGNVPNFESMNRDVLKLSCPTEFKSIKLDDLVIWVDPLDGTKEFTAGFVEYVTVLIGVVFRGKPIGGVVAQPFYKNNDSEEGYITRVVWALVGLGLFGLDPKIVPAPYPYPIDSTVSVGSVPHKVITTRSHSSPVVTTVVESFCPTEVLRYGGCGYKVLKLLEGAGHVYVYPSSGTKKWDICAPEALLVSVGGKLTDIFGESYSYDANVKHSNDYGLLATMSSDWIPAYLKCIPEKVLADLKSK